MMNGFLMDQRGKWLLFLKDSLIAAIIITVITGIPDLVYYWMEARKIHIAVDIKSSENSVAQLYYDIGNQFNEKDSDSRPILSDIGFQTLRFQLPQQAIYNLRFDPMMNAGKCALQNIRVVDGFNQVVRIIDLSVMQRLDQIQNVSIQNGQMQFEIQPGSCDPTIYFDLKYPVFFQSNTSKIGFVKKALMSIARPIIAVFLLSLFCMMFIIADLKESSVEPFI